MNDEIWVGPGALLEAADVVAQNIEIGIHDGGRGVLLRVVGPNGFEQPDRETGKDHVPAIRLAGEAYNTVGKWITDNGYRITGPCREIYVRPSKNNSQTDPETVTEIQFPVEKV